MKTLATLLVAAAFAGSLSAQRVQFSPAEQKIEDKLEKLRGMSDTERGVETQSLARQIRQLPKGNNKGFLAYALINLTTEVDFGKGILQDVTTTLDQSLQETPVPKQANGEIWPAYLELAELSRYEHMKVTLKSPEYTAALTELDATDKDRGQAQFKLTDIQGKLWSLASLKGKVVLVNFWATWCPPCRREMPDMESLYKRFKDKGFVILAISDETIDKVQPFIDKNKYTYPILLDPGRKVNTTYHVQGIPMSFLYDRKGHLVGQAIDRRSERQFLDMFARAGLK